MNPFSLSFPPHPDARRSSDSARVASEAGDPSEEWAACPFCRSMHLAVEPEVDGSTSDEAGRRVSVVCQQCGARGPGVSDEEHHAERLAAERWNQRRGAPVGRWSTRGMAG